MESKYITVSFCAFDSFFIIIIIIVVIAFVFFVFRKKVGLWKCFYWEFGNFRSLEFAIDTGTPWVLLKFAREHFHKYFSRCQKPLVIWVTIFHYEGIKVRTQSQFQRIKLLSDWLGSQKRGTLNLIVLSLSQTIRTSVSIYGFIGLSGINVNYIYIHYIHYYYYYYYYYCYFCYYYYYYHFPIIIRNIEKKLNFV